MHQHCLVVSMAHPSYNTWSYGSHKLFLGYFFQLVRLGK